jgi:hypothetical protein
VVILLGGSIVVQLVDAVVRVQVVDDARDYLAGSISASEFEDAYAVMYVAPLLSGLVTIALMVVTIVWMHRVASNQRDLGRTDTWGPGWAIAGWFLPPGVLYVIPFLVLRELWRGSDPERDTATWREGGVTPVLTAWWVLFGLAPLAFVVVDVHAALDTLGGFDDEDLARSLDDGLAIDLARAVLNVAAAVAFMVVVRRLTGRHQRLVGEVGR